MKNFPWAKNARGIGLMVGFDVEFDKVEFGRECLEENLLVVGFRPGPGPVKLTPPLTITDEEIEFALEGLDKAARRMS